MKQPDDLQHLVHFLKSEKINLSEHQVLQLQKYRAQLEIFAARHRIVSTKDIPHLVSKHFLSSFYFVRQISRDINSGDMILDLGSGAGFPGVILGIAFPNKIVMIDSMRKKTLFLKRIIKELQLDCEVINDRIENQLKKEKRIFRIITARALASIDDLIALIKPFLSDGHLHTIKGPDFKDEYRRREKEISLDFHKIDQQWANFSDYLKNKIYITFTANPR